MNLHNNQNHPAPRRSHRPVPSRAGKPLATLRTRAARPAAASAGKPLPTRRRWSPPAAKTALDLHFDNTPLWQFAITSQRQRFLLLPVYAMLLFSVFGLSLCYHASA